MRAITKDAENCILVFCFISRNFKVALGYFKVFLLASILAIQLGQHVSASEDRSNFQILDLGNGAALPALGSDNPAAGFQRSGFAMMGNYFANPANAVTTGIPSAGVLLSGSSFEAQLAAGVGSGYLTLAPGVGFQIPGTGLRFGALTDLQLNSFQWNNAKVSINWGFSPNWSIGARSTLAVVTGLVDNFTVGVARTDKILQLVADLEADGTLGTFRLWPGIGLILGTFDLGVTGALARSSNWTFYADRLKASAAIRFGRWGFAKLVYETPYLASVGLGVTL